MSPGQMMLLVRADAGPFAGTGHVMRTLALAQAWKRIGGAATFVCGQLPKGLTKQIESENFQVYQIKNDRCNGADARDTTDIASVVQPDWIVLDGYRFDDAYQQAIRSKPSKLMILDDYQHAMHRAADLILKQNIDADASCYSSSQPRVLAGSKYALVRNEFANIHSPRKIASEAKKILVTFGGDDPDNWTLRTLQILSDLNRKRMIVDCVIGASYPHVSELEMFKKSANMNLRIHRNTDRLTALMARADLAITAGGSTCYELARCGIPGIVTSIANSQKSVARAMNEQGAMISIDVLDTERTSGHPEKRLGNTIRQLINNPNLRREMSDRGMQLVDGYGADRIVSQMSAMLFPFRQAIGDDAKTTWHWRNDPEVRSVSLNKMAITFANHQSWLQQQLGDPRMKMWVSEDLSGCPVGQVCFEFSNQGKSALISIIVDQARRSRGLGTILIASAAQKFFEQTSADEIIAQVKPGNVASEKAFRAAGFRPLEPAIVKGKMALQFVIGRDNSIATSWRAARKSA